MSGAMPDARGHAGTDHAPMPLILVKLIEGVFTAPQKQEIVERLTEAMVEIGGEGLRRVTWCLVEEVAGGEWAIGGRPLTADDVKALARAGSGRD